MQDTLRKNHQPMVTERSMRGDALTPRRHEHSETQGALAIFCAIATDVLRLRVRFATHHFLKKMIRPPPQFKIPE
jgi:hypothetical protein